jgi:hypothetical protein
MSRGKPPQVGTVGSTIADGLHMTIVCDATGCHNRKTVDLEALRRELDEDYRIADFVAPSRCRKCGAKWPRLSVGVGAIHTGGMRG